MENKDKLYLHINVVMDRDTDKQEYFWNKISSYLESMGMECLGSSEYQPLERISEETKKLRCMKCGRVAKNGESLNSNKNGTFIECDDCMWEVEPLQNGEREELKAEFFKKFVDETDACPECVGYLDNTNADDVWEWIESKLSQSKKEGIEEALEEINEILGTNIKYVNGEYKVVFRELSKLTTK